MGVPLSFNNRKTVRWATLLTKFETLKLEVDAVVRTDRVTWWTRFVESSHVFSLAFVSGMMWNRPSGLLY
jgi:hypothetical protein